MSAMDLPDQAVGATEAPLARPDLTDRHIRGSTLLVVGRVIELAINLVVQILIVRYLSKSDYGAFAYALSILAFSDTICVGLGAAITRFAPIFHERGDFPRLFGTMAMVLGIMLSLGLASILLVYGLRGVIEGSLSNDRHAVSLLLVLILLAPVQAVDTFIMNLFAVFARPRAIFFRRHIVAPGLRLAAVLLLTGAGGGVRLLAVGYVVASITGAALYSVFLVRTLRAEGILGHLNRARITVPFRQILSFVLPLLTTSLVWVLVNSIGVLLLGHYRGTSEVAAFRVILPAATLNQVIISSFVVLFTPMAARLFARDDRYGIEDLYWRTAVFLAVLTFPIFALTFGSAEPVTRLLYGARYGTSGLYLAILAVGNYAQAMTGFNGQTLMVFGKIRYIITTNAVVVVTSLALNFLLIPRYGALGAAIATTGSLVLHNIVKQLGLHGSMSVFPRRYAPIYASIALGAGALLVFRLVASGTTVGLLGGAAVVSAVVVVVNRRALQLGRTFPELLRIPIVRSFIV